MRLTQANKILLGSCLVVVPLSFYGGLALKEKFLASELDKVPESSELVSERAVKARIVQLEQERKELLTEGRDLDKKIEEIKARIAAKQCKQAQRTRWADIARKIPHLQEKEEEISSSSRTTIHHSHRQHLPQSFQHCIAFPVIAPVAFPLGSLLTPESWTQISHHLCRTGSPVPMVIGSQCMLHSRSVHSQTAGNSFPKYPFPVLVILFVWPTPLGWSPDPID